MTLFHLKKFLLPLIATIILFLIKYVWKELALFSRTKYNAFSLLIFVPSKLVFGPIF